MKYKITFLFLIIFHQFYTQKNEVKVIDISKISILDSSDQKIRTTDFLSQLSNDKLDSIKIILDLKSYKGVIELYEANKLVFIESIDCLYSSREVLILMVGIGYDDRLRSTNPRSANSILIELEMNKIRVSYISRFMSRFKEIITIDY